MSALKILIVDDFSTMRRIIKNLLRDIGFTDCLEAENGINALQLLETNKFDFVITDWNMPQMSGIELLQAIRAKPNLAKLPVLMVTAEAKREQILSAMKAGVSGYIVKPFTAQLLHSKIKHLLGNN